MAIPGWNYVRPITISNSGSVLTNYQVLVSNPIYNETGLVGSWHFNEGSGTIAYDTSGNNNNGTLTNGPTWVDGKFGKALSFDGVNDVVSLGTTGIPSGNSQYAIMAWIKPNAMGNYGIMGWGSWGTTNAVNAFRLSATGLVNYWWSNDLAVTTQNLADGNWHQVVAQFDGTTRSIWVDGVKKGQDTPTGHNAVATNVNIGRTSNSEYFSGLIDEVRIYNRALSAGEIYSLYQAKAKPNYGDIRFTDANGVNLLNYWMEADGKFWVKVPSIPAGTKTIYVYYGNPNATSASNGGVTFDFFDDFDPDKVSWTVLAGTWNNQLGYAGNSKVGTHDGTAGAKMSLANGYLPLADFILHAKMRSTVENSLANIVFRAVNNDNDGNNRIWVRLDYRNADINYRGFSLTQDVNGSRSRIANYEFVPTLGRWYDVKLEVHGSTVAGYLDGVLRWTANVSITSAGYLQLQVEYQNGHNAWFDNIFIRKYASTEPTTSVGSEMPTVGGSFLLTFLDQL